VIAQADAVAPDPTWQFAVALAVLVVFAIAASFAGNLRIHRATVTATLRATVQLLVVAAVVSLVLERWWAAVGFACVMLGVATLTAAGRTDTRHRWYWVAGALTAGAGPVLAVIFGLGAVPRQPATIVSICGIVIGNSMTAFVLAGRRAFSNLRERFGQAEGAMALGISRTQALRFVVEHEAPESLTPVLDQTRTVGLVSLPGAFVGVLLGGGTAAQAATAQLLVLVGLIAAQSIVIVAVTRLIGAARLLPHDLEARLPPA
jgi:putative ABC transport system permease protein